MKDALGDRMKNFYENRFKQFLPRRQYTVIRIDGKAFHTFTRGMNRPFDSNLIECMNQTAIYLCSKIQGAKLAYVQSDEISILLTDFDTLKTDAWFDYNLQKMCSVSASMATVAFNTAYKRLFNGDKSAEFDSRVMQLPTRMETLNVFRWRQQDAVRNSVQSVAQSLYSQKELHGKGNNELQELIFQKGINWNNYSSWEKRGRVIVKETYMKGDAERSRWICLPETPDFMSDEAIELIPERT